MTEERDNQAVFSPTRRLHLWVKHSLTSTTATSFQEEEEVEENEHILEFPPCRNIDEALEAFRVEEPTAFGGGYDWILDGRIDDDYHARRSRELIQELRAPDIEDVVSPVDQILGQQDLQFASFPTVSESLEDDDEEFGDFQAADGDTDGFGGFQEGNHDEKDDSDKSATKQQPEDDAMDEVLVEEKTDGEEVLDEEPVLAGEKTDGEEVLEEEPVLVGEKKDGEEALEEEPELPIEVLRVPTVVKLKATPSEHSLDILSCSSCSSSQEEIAELDKLDLSTPEGRFLRRQMPEQSPVSVSLPQHFFRDTDSSSLSEAVVRSLPWKHVPMVQKQFRNTTNSQQDMEVVEEHLVSQLMQLDGWFASITAQSLRQGSSRKSSLELCNQHVRGLNHSLTMADMYAHRSKKSLKEARGNQEDYTGLASGMILLEAWDQRDVYRDLDELLSHCTRLLDQEQQLQQQIDAFGHDTSRFEEIMEAARLFSASAHQDEQLSKLTALDGLRERADHVLDAFAKEVESLLVQHLSGSCISWKKFCSTKYDNLLKAMICLRQQQGAQHAVSEIWTKCIVDTLLFEAEKCLSRALLDPTNMMDSAHDKELLELEYALQEDHGDFAKLKTVSHNLVTIRFDFEASHNYLPMVYHRLCMLLTDVLYCHCLLVKWHESNTYQDKEATERIHRQLLMSKAKLLKRCEQVLVSCLEEYLNFATKKKLFGDKTDDSPWINDLEAMHDVLQLTQQFSKIGKEFVDKDAQQKVSCLLDESPDKALGGKLCAVFRKHLRAVHVETMNSMGFMLSKESWQLVPLDPVDKGLTGFCSSETEFKAYLVKLVGDMMPQASFTQRRRLWDNRVRTSQDTFFSVFADYGNPFDVVSTEDTKKNYGALDNLEYLEWTGPECVDETDISDVGSPGVYELVASIVENNLTADSRIAVQSCFKGFAKCVARLLLVTKKLPIILPDVAKVIQNVSDLFLTTVFRLCAGNAVNENIILGIESPTPYLVELPVGKRRSSAPRVGFGRRSSSSEGLTRPHQPITPKLEAEICAPLPCENVKADSLRKFIQRAQGSLQGMVKLDMIQGWIGDPPAISPEESEDEYLCKVCTCLEKRQAAAWSCLFVAAILDLVKNFAVSNLTKGALARMLGEEQQGLDSTALLNGVTSLADYVDSVLKATPEVVHFATRMACARAIGSRRIVEEICRAEWDTSQLSESANRYMELVCGRYAFIWRFLSTSAKLPIVVRSQTWENLVAVGYMTCLEGFARIPYCSTEGRSSMSMDLAAFCSGISPSAIQERMDLDVIPRPPTTTALSRGRQYVDTYIKVSYFPQEDIMNWIATNHTDYHLNHCIALTSGRADLARNVESLYTKEGGKNEGLEHRSTP